MSNSLPGTQHFLSKLWGELTDWEKSPVCKFLKEAAVYLLVRRAWKDDDVVWIWGDSVPQLLGTGKHTGVFFSVLIKALSGSNKRARINAAKDLREAASGKIDISPAVPAMISALEDEEPEVRWNVAMGLGEAAKNGIDVSSAVPGLMNMIWREGGRHTPAFMCAISSLADIGPREYNDLKELASLARALKSEGAKRTVISRVTCLYSEWSKKLNSDARALVLDKKFPIPKVEKPEKTERVLRVRRVG